MADEGADGGPACGSDPGALRLLLAPARAAGCNREREGDGHDSDEDTGASHVSLPQGETRSTQTGPSGAKCLVNSAQENGPVQVIIWRVTAATAGGKRSDGGSAKEDRALGDLRRLCARGGRSVRRPGGPGAHRAGGAPDLRPRPTGHPARALAGEGRGGARHGCAGVRGPGPGRVGSLARDVRPGAGVARIPRQHQAEDRGRARRGPGRIGREDPGDHTRHQEGDREVRLRSGHGRTPARRRVPAGRQSVGVSALARTARRTLVHRGPGRGHGRLHAAGAPGPARSGDRHHRTRPSGGHDQGLRRGQQPGEPSAAHAVARQPGLRGGRCSSGS